MLVSPSRTMNIIIVIILPTYEVGLRISVLELRAAIIELIF